MCCCVRSTWRGKVLQKGEKGVILLLRYCQVLPRYTLGIVKVYLGTYQVVPTNLLIKSRNRGDVPKTDNVFFLALYHDGNGAATAVFGIFVVIVQKKTKTCT